MEYQPTQKLTLYFTIDAENPETFYIETYDSTYHYESRVLVETREVDIPLPIVDRKQIVLAAIEKLREEKNKVLAEAQLKANAFDDKIQKLLCLEAPKETEDNFMSCSCGHEQEVFTPEDTVCSACGMWNHWTKV
jgi:hypothetical protein